MSFREKLLIDYLSKSDKALIQLQKEGFPFLDRILIWQILIYEFGHYYNPTGVLLHKLSSLQIVERINNYFKKNGLPIKNITINYSIIPEELNDELIKAKVKFAGEVWTIHQNDKDTFPSQPHAHNYDRQYKLHLGNGKLFRRKKCVGAIKYKDLVKLRNILSRKIHNISLPPLAG